VTRRPLLVILALALAVPAAPALADAPTKTVTAGPPPGPAGPPPVPVPPPTHQARARIALSLAGTYRVGRQQVTVLGRRFRIDGRIVPYVAGEHVTVRVWRGHALLRSVVVRPRPSRTRHYGTFQVHVSSAHSGRVAVFTIHPASAAQASASKEALVSVLAPSAGPGTRSLFVSLLQARLAAVGYAVPRSGAYDDGTQRAVLAFRKVNGMPRVTSIDGTIVDRLLRGVGGFRIRYPRHGRHVEANLAWQVLALIDKGRVVRAYVTSSGKPSTPTVLGSFRFYEKTPGTNAKDMVDANYFFRGYAIHGYFDVPPYNASHGCLRVPIPDAPAIYAWIRLGDRIDVYS
jgi:peptidoglycan hydrolase-like protein with peptidoglycan-binding domain